MAARPKPPADITTDDFYLKWLPEQAAAAPDQAAKLKGINAVIQVVLTGEGGGEYYMKIEDGKFATAKGKAESPKLTITQTIADWRAINAGTLNPQMAFMSGKLKISGDMSLAMKLGSIMGG
ncbi:MAG: SCP2 sterol-binding domain-containing protein [bacterium]